MRRDKDGGNKLTRKIRAASEEQVGATMIWHKGGRSKRGTRGRGDSGNVYWLPLPLATHSSDLVTVWCPKLAATGCRDRWGMTFFALATICVSLWTSRNAPLPFPLALARSGPVSTPRPAGVPASRRPRRERRERRAEQCGWWRRLAERWARFFGEGGKLALGKREDEMSYAEIGEGEKNKGKRTEKG